MKLEHLFLAIATLFLGNAAPTDNIGHVPVTSVGFHGDGVSGSVNLGCLTYGNDAGCSTQSQYAIRSDGVTHGAASHTVGESTNQFYCAYYSAQAGQLPSDGSAHIVPVSSSDPTWIRNNDLHADNSNIPGCDPWYRLGPDPDTYLTPIDLYGTTGHPDLTGGMCHYDSMGSVDVDSNRLHGPAIVCHVPGGSSTSVINYAIYGYDFSTLSTDSKKHTRSGMLDLIPQYGNGYSGGGPTNIVLTIGNSYFCNCSAAGQSSGAELAAIVLGNASGVPVRTLIIGNVYFDGGFRNRSSDTTGNWKFVEDHRSTYDRSLVNMEIHDSYLYDLGHDPITGDGNDGPLVFQDSAVWGYCQSNCHAELAQLATGAPSATFPANTIPLNLYKNLFTMNPATYLGGFATGNTAPVYFAGSFHRVLYSAFVLQHVHSVVNGYSCTNMQQSYTPTRRCLGGVQGGSAGIYQTSTTSLDFSDNVMDGTGSIYCTTDDSAYFYSSIIGGPKPKTWSHASIASGTNLLNVPLGDYTFGPDANYFPSSLIISGRKAYVNGNTYAGVSGFIDTYITGYGTARDAPTFSASLSGGVITLATAGNLDPGQHIYLASTGADLGVIQSGGSGTRWATSNTTASYAAGTQFKSLNPTTDCTPGMSRGCGTYTLSQTEPVSVADTSVLMAFSTSLTYTGSGNYSIGGRWSGGGHRAWPVSNLAKPGPQNCT